MNVLKRRVMVGMAGAAAIAAAIAVAPAIGATGTASRPSQTFAPSADDIGTFTPAAADPRLAALLARAAASTTTASASRPRRPATRRIAASPSPCAHARPPRPPPPSERPLRSPPRRPRSASRRSPTIWACRSAGGASAVGGDMTHIDLAGQPGSRDSVGASVSYTGRKFSGRVRAAADKPAAGHPGAGRRAAGLHGRRRAGPTR